MLDTPQSWQKNNKVYGVDDDKRISDIQTTTHDLDKRVTVLESRMDGVTQRLAAIESRLDAIWAALRAHIQTEEADRLTLLSRVTWTLFAALAGLVGWAGQEVFARVFAGQ